MSIRHQLVLLTIVVAMTFAGGYWITHGVGHDSMETQGQGVSELPLIHFYDRYGKKVTLKDFKGKVVLLNLWATWCTPCVAEMPMLDRLQAMLPKDDFKVVALSVDRSSIENVINFIDNNNLKNIDVFLDQDREASLKWKYDIIPTSFLLDRRGKVIGEYRGIFEWDKEPLLQRIRDAL